MLQLIKSDGTIADLTTKHQILIDFEGDFSPLAKVRVFLNGQLDESYAPQKIGDAMEIAENVLKLLTHRISDPGLM